MTPDEIYLRAVEAQRARPVPAHVDYDVSIRATGATIGCPHGAIVVTFGSGNSQAAFRVAYRGEGAAARSTDLRTQQTCAGVPLIDPAGGDIGGLLAASHDSGKIDATKPGENTIAMVRATGVSHYAVVASSSETLDARNVFHLTLHAIADPVTYPLTDLYVDASDYHVARVVGRFVDRYGGAPASIVATGDFTLEGDYSIETHERVEFSAETQPARIRATLEATATNVVVAPP